MSDQRVRAQERRWREGRDPEEEARWLRERLRAGELDLRRLTAASLLGHPPARMVVGPPPDLDAAALARLGGGGLVVELAPDPPAVALVRLVGWSGDARRLGEALDAVLALDPWSVVLEVEDGEAFRASSGFLSAIARSGYELSRGGAGELLLVDVPGPLATLIGMVGLNAYLDLEPTRNSALARARARAWSLTLEPLEPGAGVRLGVAALRAALPGWRERAPHDPRLERALRAAEAWLREPAPEAAQAAVTACLDLLELWQAGGQGPDPALDWALWLGHHPALAAGPRRAGEVEPRPRLFEPEAAAVRAEVLEWLLA